MLKPRAVIAQVRPSKRATWTPVTRRSASGSVVIPARRMSSPVTTEMAAAAALIGSACFSVDVTSMFDSSSIDSCLSVWAWASGSTAATCCCAPTEADAMQIRNTTGRTDTWGTPLSRTPVRSTPLKVPPTVLWSAPLPPHSLLNIGTADMHIISVELKDTVA